MVRDCGGSLHIASRSTDDTRWNEDVRHYDVCVYARVDLMILKI